MGRFTTQDPLAPDFASWTPYHYVHNNPLILIDPTGMSADWFENELTGEVMNVKGESTIPATEEAKGYVRMGDDDMFGEENIPEGQEGTVTRMNAEESQEFMADQGYEFKTKESYEAIRHEDIGGVTPSGNSYSVKNKTGERMVTARTYVKPGSGRKSRIKLFTYDEHPDHSYTSYTRTNYSNKKWGGSQTGGDPSIKTVYKWEDVKNPKLLKLKGK